VLPGREMHAGLVNLRLERNYPPVLRRRHQPNLMSDRHQPQIRVVLPQPQPMFGAAGEQPVRLPISLVTKSSIITVKPWSRRQNHGFRPAASRAG